MKQKMVGLDDKTLEYWKVNLKYAVPLQKHYLSDSFRTQLKEQYEGFVRLFISEEFNVLRKVIRPSDTQYLMQLKAKVEPLLKEERRGPKKMIPELAVALLYAFVHAGRNASGQKQIRAELERGGEVYAMFEQHGLCDFIPQLHRQADGSILKWAGQVKENLLRNLLTPYGERTRKIAIRRKHQPKLIKMLKENNYRDANLLVRDIHERRI